MISNLRAKTYKKATKPKNQKNEKAQKEMPISWLYYNQAFNINQEKVLHSRQETNRQSKKKVKLLILGKIL